MPFQEPISLAYALEIHDTFKHCSTIPNNICDGFLYSTNPLFRNVRDSAVAFGTTFTENDFCHYRAFFRASLQKILANKCVFYVDNVTRLKEIEKKHPKRFDFSLIRKSASTNSIHHESSHIICDSIFTAKLFNSVKHKDLDQKQLLRVMIGEAVASTHDSLMSVFNYTRFMQEVTLFQDGTHKLKWEKSIFEPVMDIVDYAGAYKITFMAFLYSYFLYQNIDRKALDRVLGLLFPETNFSSNELSRFRKIFQNAFTVSSVIRLREHGLYFQILMDCDRSLEDLCRFDFVSVFEKNDFLIGKLETIIKLIHFGPQNRNSKTSSLNQAKLQLASSKHRTATRLTS